MSPARRFPPKKHHLHHYIPSSKSHRTNLLLLYSSIYHFSKKMSNANTFTSKFCGAIEQLNSLNYLQWPSSMTHFASTEIDDIVQGQRKYPPAGSEHHDISMWERDDSRAKGALPGACTPAMRAHIESADVTPPRPASTRITPDGGTPLATRLHT